MFYDRKKDCYNCPFIRACINELARKDNARRNKELYRRLKEDKNYGHVKYDRISGGMSASHKEHNFDKVGGKYEKTAQNVGRRNGHAVILEKLQVGKPQQKTIFSRASSIVLKREPPRSPFWFIQMVALMRAF